MVFFAAVVHPKTARSGGFRLCLEQRISEDSGGKKRPGAGVKISASVNFLLTAIRRGVSGANANCRWFRPHMRRGGIIRPAQRNQSYAGIADSGMIAPRCWITVLAVRCPRAAAAWGEPPVRRCDR